MRVRGAQGDACVPGTLVLAAAGEESAGNRSRKGLGERLGCFILEPCPEEAFLSFCVSGDGFENLKFEQTTLSAHVH